MKCIIIISIIVLTFSSSRLWAQLTNGEVRQIQNLDLTDHQFDPRRPKFLKVGNNFLTRYNPVSLLFSSSLYIYQKAISPQLQSKCPYEISCSAFSKACIEEFGLIKGLALSADRLTRCTQFSVTDINSSQFNDRTGNIIDNPSKYKVQPRHSK